MKTLYKTVLFFGLFTILSSSLFAQCPFPTLGFGSGVAPSPGNSVIIETCNFVGEYETVSGVQALQTYTVNYSGGAGAHVVVYDPTNTPIAWGDITVQFTAAQSGTYYSSSFIDSTCNGTDPNFTCNASLWTNDTTSLSLQNLSVATFSASPNPTKGIVSVSFEGSDASVVVSNLQGKVVYSNKVNNGDKIDLSSFDAGIYFFNFQLDGKNETLRIVQE